MSKQLPYYQFEVAEYLAGDVMICSLEAQGLFSVVKCLYWQKECKLNIKQILKRYDKKDLIDELKEEGCLKIDSDGNIEISFLKSQFEDLTERKTRLSEAGRKGGLKKKEATLKPSLSDDKATPKHKEEKRREEKNIKEDGLTPTQKVLEFDESKYEQPLIDGFKRFCNFIDQTQKVLEIQSQINIDSYKKICEEHGAEKLKEKITDLDKWLTDPNVPKGKKKKKSLTHLMQNTWLKNGY